MLKGSPELLRRWVNEGYNNQAVADYGTSVEFLEKALTSGEIPWNAPQPDIKLLSFQEKFLSRGGYLYYAYPFVDNIERHKPSLARRLRNVVEYSDNQIRNSIVFFAALNGMTHQFESQTGIKLNDPYKLVGLTHLLFPDLVKFYEKDELLKSFFYRFTDTVEWEEPPHLGFSKPDIPLAQLKDTLKRCIERRGLIVYYNQELLKHKVIPGVEIESEIMILTKKPLTLEAISGIEPLSKADSEAIDNLSRTLSI